MKNIKTFTNYDTGWQSVISEGNEKFAYKVEMHDLMEGVIDRQFFQTYSCAEKYAIECIKYDLA